MKNRILSFICALALLFVVLFSDVSMANEENYETPTDAVSEEEISTETDASEDREVRIYSKDVSIVGASAVGKITVTAKPTFSSVTKNKKTFNNGTISDLYNSSTGKCYACNYAVDHIIAKNLDFYGLSSFSAVPWGSYVNGLTNLGFKKVNTGMEGVCLKHANATLINSSMKAFNFQAGDIIVMYACNDSSSDLHTKSTTSGCSKGTVGHVLVAGSAGWTNSDGSNATTSYYNGIKYTGTAAGSVSNGKVYDMLVSVAEYSSVYSGGAFFEVYRMPEKPIPKVSLGLVKESSNHDLTDDNDCYSFKGATYDLYDIKNATNYSSSSSNIKVGTFTIDNYNTQKSVGSATFVMDGSYETTASSYYGQNVTIDLSSKKTVNVNGIDVDTTLIKNLPLSNYAVVETSSGNSKTYKVDGTPRVITFAASENGAVKIFNTSDSAYTPDMNLVLKKVGKSVIPSFDGITLSGVTYRIDYYFNSRATGEIKKNWYFTTDTNGEIKFDSAHLNNEYSNSDFYIQNGTVILPFGTIKVTEINTLNNYILDTNSYTFTIDNTNSYIPQTFTNDKRREIYVKITKKDKSTNEIITSSNCDFKIWSYEKDSYIGKVSTDTSGSAVFSEKLNMGRYRIDEEVAPLGYEIGESVDFEVTEDKIYEFVVDENGDYTGEEMIFVEFFDEPKIPEISTSANASDITDEGLVKIDEVVQIIDRVDYKGLIPGKEYLVKGVLYDKATNEPLLIGGSIISSEKQFIPENEDGWVMVEFELDTRELAEKEIVCFETLYLDEKEVAVHADINDKSQTVVVEKSPEPSEQIIDEPVELIIPEETTEITTEEPEEITTENVTTEIPDEPVVSIVHTGDGAPLAAIISVLLASFIGVLIVSLIKNKKLK